jgi:hypothetical protein
MQPANLQWTAYRHRRSSTHQQGQTIRKFQWTNESLYVVIDQSLTPLRRQNSFRSSS